MKNKNTEISDWLKKQVDDKFEKDLGFTNIKTWFSPDRPHPDLVVQCIDNDGEQRIFRFLVV
jgi:hypothetical protein